MGHVLALASQVFARLLISVFYQLDSAFKSCKGGSLPPHTQQIKYVSTNPSHPSTLGQVGGMSGDDCN